MKSKIRSNDSSLSQTSITFSNDNFDHQNKEILEEHEISEEEQTVKHHHH
jgi:hypothetical protein